MSQLTTDAAPTNRAFLFIKPNAATPAMEKLVEATLAAKGIKILQKGVIDLRDIVFFAAFIAAWLYACALIVDARKAD